MDQTPDIIHIDEVDPLMEPEFLVDDDETTDEAPQDNQPHQTEMFECSACNVQFDSVEKHIEKFHLGQEVQIEEENSEVSQEWTPDNELVEVITVDREGNLIVTDEESEDSKSAMIDAPRSIISTKIACTECPSRFATRQALSAHMRVHKHKIKPSIDARNPAGKIFDTIHLFVDDEQCGDEEPDKSTTKGDEAGQKNFVCDVCNTTFMSNKSLRLHVRMHLPIKDKTLEQVAGIEMKTRLKTGDADDGSQFDCPICDKTFAIGFREMHMKTHNGEEKFSCGSCNITFSGKNMLDMHMAGHQKIRVIETKASKNNIRLPYGCQYCGKEFARPHEKVKHERIHTGEKPHGCEICGKRFRVTYCLTLHMRTHTDDRPFVCPHCNKRYKAHSVYNHHLLTHSDVRAFQCPFCPKSFKTHVQLSGHKNTHTKPFSCPECNRPFANLYSLKVHIETHKRTNHTMKHSCQHCGATYTRGFALKNHIKDQHPDIELMDEIKMEEDMIEMVEHEFDAEPIMDESTGVDDGMIISEVEHFANEEIVTDWMK